MIEGACKENLIEAFRLALAKIATADYTSFASKHEREIIRYFMLEN